MKRTHVHRMVAVALGLMVVGLVALQPAGGVSGQESARFSDEEILIVNENFVFRSEFMDFDVHAFLKLHSPWLSTYREFLLGSDSDVGDMIELVAYYHSINPKVLLALIEVQAGLLSTPHSLEARTMGYKASQIQKYELSASDGNSLFSQTILMAESLVDGYYSIYNEQELRGATWLSFADGSRLEITNLANPATFAIQKALAEVNTVERWQELVSVRSERGFYKTYFRLFGEDPLWFAPPIRTQAGPYPDLKLPWPKDSVWYFTSGPHQTNAVDFASPGSGCSRDRWIDDWVAATRQGKVVTVSQVLVVVEHGDGWRTGYFHVPSEDRVSNGQEVSQGDHIGHPGCCGDGTQQYTCTPGQWCSCNSWCSCSGNWNCCATGAHVHLMLYKDGNKETWNGKTISGWTIQSTNGEYQGKMVKSGEQDRVADARQSSSCVGHSQCNDYSWGRNDLVSDNGGQPPPPPCPQSGGVILYQHWHYDCGGEGEGHGYVRRDGTGWQNVGGDFDNRASSVRVPSGWSVKLFEHPDRGGGWVCRTSDDNDFSGDKFVNDVNLNDAVSSFEVFHDSRCGEPENRAPNTPWPTSPSDGHVAHDGRAPTLCWGNPGDPDGNSLEFYAEVYESDVNANSGWISGTCWRPSQLDGHYHDYKWHVKARDIPHHEESDWSDRSNPP